jgi:hypothetical protein
MDELDTICNELLEDPADEEVIDKVDELNNVDVKPIIDVDKLILRLDGLENENKELSNKLEKITGDYTKLIEYMKIMGNRIKNIDGKPNLETISRTLKNDHNLSMIRMYKYNNPSNTCNNFSIFNKHKLLKELKNITLIEENIQYLKNNKVIIDMLDRYKFIQNFMNLIEPHEKDNYNRIKVESEYKHEYDEYNTIRGLPLNKQANTGQFNQGSGGTTYIKEYLCDIRAFGVLDTDYLLHPYPKEGEMRRDNAGKGYLFKHYSPEMKKKIKQYNKDLEYCRNNFNNFIKSINDIFKLKEKIII